MARCSVVLGLVVSVACAAFAQHPGAGPAAPPANDIEVCGDGHCALARAGDRVHFSLTLDGADAAQSVMADLQMRSGRGGMRNGDLPLPGEGAIGGGGAGERDAQSPKQYHFAFAVPAGAAPGVYRGLGVMVVVRDGAGMPGPVDAGVDRHAREQVRRFCLAVLGKEGYLEGVPVVTDFKGGPVEPRR